MNDSNEKKYAIGVDYGTNSVRALIVDLADGNEISTAVCGYPTGDLGVILDATRPTLARQSPRDYVDCFYSAVSQAVANAKKTLPEFEPKQVVGIGVDSTGSTPLPVDKDGVPLAFKPEFANVNAAQAWLWKDHTAIEEAEKITARVYETGNGYLEKCGGTYSSEWYWAKIWRCKKERRDVFDAAYSWVELADFIPAYITGNLCPETLSRGICAAGHKAMFDASRGGLPSREFLASLDPDLAVLRDRFAPQTKTAQEVAGYLTEESAAKTGLAPGTAVAVGAFDCHMGAVGAGVKPGTLVKIMGTSTCDVTVLPLDARIGAIPGVCGVVPGSVLPDAFGIEAGQSAVGDIFRWFERSLTPAKYGRCDADGELSDSALVELERDAAKLLPGESGLIALDWNNGNRCVLVDQALTGAVIGTTLSTTAAEVYRALVESTAFGALAIVERLEEYGVKIDEIVVCGGIAEKSPLTMQIYADVLNRPFKIARSAQACALGAAIFGAVAGGAFESVAEAQARTTGFKSTVYRPNPESAEVYRKLYAEYKTLHDAFGVKDSNANVYPVMKNLIAIRDAVRSSRLSDK